MKKIIVLLSVALLFYGCVNRNKKESIDSVVLNVVVTPSNNQQKIELKDITNNLTLIRLETNRECLIKGMPNKVEIFNDRIYIFDISYPGKLYCFDLQGKFLFNISSVGNGPGEYVSLLDFTLDKENMCLWLGDDARKILKYDLNGVFIKQYPTDFSIKNLCLLDEKESIMAIRLGFYKEKKSSFVIYSMNENQILYQKESENIAITRTVAGRFFSESKKHILYTEPFNDTVFVVTKEGLAPYYVIDFGKRKFPSELFDNDPQPREIITKFTNSDNQYAGLVSNANEDSNYLFFNYRFSGLAQTAVYSIKSDKLMSINEFTFMGKPFSASGSLFHIKKDNKLVYFLPAELFAEKGTLKKEEQQEFGRYSDITKKLPVTMEDDNPIMVIGEINFDNLFLQ